MLTTVEEIGEACGGYAMEDGNSVYIPVVLMEHPGRGQGGTFLDALPTDRTIKFPCVISPLLREMLERRGYTLTWEWAEEFGEVVECYVRWSERRRTAAL